MCRNIKPLFNFDPIATDEEIKNAAIQFVRKISGFQKPSLDNQEAFEVAVLEISMSTQKLITTLKTNSKPKNREEEVLKKKLKYEKQNRS